MVWDLSEIERLNELACEKHRENLPETIAGKDIRQYYEDYCLAVIRLNKLRRLAADVCCADATTASDELCSAVAELTFEMRRQEL